MRFVTALRIFIVSLLLLTGSIAHAPAGAKVFQRNCVMCYSNQDRWTQPLSHHEVTARMVPQPLFGR